jgi:hypothetical protein
MGACNIRIACSPQARAIGLLQSFFLVTREFETVDARKSMGYHQPEERHGTAYHAASSNKLKQIGLVVRLRPEPLDLDKYFFFLVTRVYERIMGITNIPSPEERLGSARGPPAYRY